MGDHLDGFVVVVLDEDVVGEGDADTLTIIISLKEQMKILFNNLLLLLILIKPATIALATTIPPPEPTAQPTRTLPLRIGRLNLALARHPSNVILLHVPEIDLIINRRRLIGRDSRLLLDLYL